MRIADDTKLPPPDLSEARVPASADWGYWAGINVLVYGPPGSGKLSFVRGLSRVARPMADVHVYDFQTELSEQRELVLRLLSALEPARPDPAHLIRHLHRIQGTLLWNLVNELAEAIGRRQAAEPSTPSLCVHATSYGGVQWPKAVRERLDVIFPCWVQLTEGSVCQRDLSGFVRQVVRDLNRQYGRTVTEVDAEILAACRQVAGHSLHQMRNLIERVYITSCGSRLSGEHLRQVIKS